MLLIRKRTGADPKQATVILCQVRSGILAYARLGVNSYFASSERTVLETAERDLEQLYLDCDSAGRGSIDADLCHFDLMS
jgi:hypothetical protein